VDFRVVKIGLKTLCTLFFLSTYTTAAPCLFIDSSSGAVEVQRAGSQLFQPAKPGMKLCDNDRIHVPGAGYASLIWPDSSTTFLHPNSLVRINTCEDENPDGKAVRYATLYFGVSFFTVKKIAPHGLFDDCALRVFTPTASISVRGTAFEVAVDSQSGSTGITVLSGTVQVRSTISDKQLYLGAPYRTTVSKVKGCSALEPVTTKDVDSLKKWLPPGMIAAVMDKQIARVKNDFGIMTAGLQDRCIISLFTNNSNYEGPWHLNAGTGEWLAESLRRAKPRVTFSFSDSATGDPVESARTKKARFAVQPSFEVFDLAQRGEISPRADEYREFAVATVRVRIRLYDASTGSILAEESGDGEATDTRLAENAPDRLNRLKFDLHDSAFASSIVGLALKRALDTAAKKTAPYFD
jgi:hypothetical protein